MAGLQPGLADRLARAATHAWPRTATRATPPEAGVRAARTPDDSGWRVDVRCVLSEGHRALDVAREVRSRVLSAAQTHLREHHATDPVTVTVTVTGFIAKAPGPLGAR
ncbi:hypothetical protein [Streptomyces sp. Ru72]|uniref:hypothetical protein n=1 Tax=Streptomyces sp. Ru72 TaxID=2080747 RepID=UPI00215663BF|nr:hypothetical protein [Streptomyces sp. Ru72]